jgi:hypothetical protein
MKMKFSLVIIFLFVCLCYGGEDMKKKLFLDASYSYNIETKSRNFPFEPVRKHDPSLGISFELPLFATSFSLFTNMNYSFSKLIGSSFRDTTIHRDTATGWVESDYTGTSSGHTVQFFILPSFYVKNFVFSFGWRIDVSLVNTSYDESIYSLANGAPVGVNPYHCNGNWALWFDQEPFMIRCGYVIKNLKIDLIADRLTSWGVCVSYAIKKW